MIQDTVIGAQCDQLRTLLDNPGVDWSSADLRVHAIQFFRDFGRFAPEANRSALADAIRAKLGLSPAQFALAVGECDDEQKVKELLSPPGSKQEAEDIYPKGGWIGKYIEYTRHQLSPTVFHFWNAIAVLGATMGRRVFFDKFYYRIYPNHYIVLVAPTGKCKKSTAINIAVGILRDADIIEILSEKGTPEGIIDAMSKQPAQGTPASSSLFIHAPELGVFLGKQRYNEDLVLLLTSLADSRDGPFDYWTRKSGKIVLHSPTVHLLGAVTPDGLAHSIPKTALLGGSISRFIFVSQSKTDRKGSLPKPPDENLRTQLQTQLVKLAGVRHRFEMTPAAERWYQDWFEVNMASQPEIMQLSGYLERKPDHLIRLAIVLKASEEDFSAIDEAVLEKALKIMNEAERHMPAAFTVVDSTEEGHHYEIVISA